MRDSLDVSPPNQKRIPAVSSAWGEGCRMYSAKTCLIPVLNWSGCVWEDASPSHLPCLLAEVHVKVGLSWTSPCGPCVSGSGAQVPADQLCLLESSVLGGVNWSRLPALSLLLRWCGSAFLVDWPVHCRWRAVGSCQGPAFTFQCWAGLGIAMHRGNDALQSSPMP